MNPDHERLRLAAVYSKMSEEELRAIASDATSLTDEALNALQAEISRRNLAIPVIPAPAGTSGVELQKLVTIRKFRDLPEAVLAKGLLESAGIECSLADDNIVRMDWFISNFVGGIKLQVRMEDVAAANEILDQPIPENFDVEGVGDYQQPRCPQCDSMQISFEELNKPVAYASAWIGVPVPLHKKGWRCKSCGYEWSKDALEDTESV